MNILQVVPYFFIDWSKGKPVETVYGLSKALVYRGHNVTIFTTNAYDKSRKSVLPLDVDGIKVYEFNSFGSIGRKHHVCFSPSIVSMMERLMPEFNVVYLHEYRTFQNVVAYHYARKCRIPYVLQAYGSLPMMESKSKLKQVYDGLWGHSILRDASKVIVATKKEAQQFWNFGVGEDKVKIISTGIDLAEFDNLPTEGTFRKKYGIYSNQKIVLFLGRINKIKGLAILVGAFAHLAKTQNDVKLVIAGADDGYLATIKELVWNLGISEFVIFTGALYGQSKLEAYVDSDVYVLPSIYETFGITILEAWACGKPVIVTDRCGIADVIKNQAGIVVPYSDTDLLIALQQMLGDSKMREQFGENGRRLVHDKFNWAKIAEQTESILEEVIA